MRAPSISSANVVRVEAIDVVRGDTDLIDIEVEGQHTFWVSDNDRDWTLTHNSGAPDIDTDLADRDKVLDELRGFFGWENVVPISTYNCFKLKTLIKDLGKFYGVSFEETNAATRTVEDEVRKATMKEGDDKNLFVLKFDEAMGYHCAVANEPDAKPVCQGCSPDCKVPVSQSFHDFIDKYPQVAESIKILFKQNRSLGRHAGGVLIADDLPNKMPLVTSKSNGKGGVREPQSPWCEGVNFKHLEKIGEFIKYDLLGLETLRLIERTIELIIQKEDGIVEIEVEGIKHRLSSKQCVKLTNGTYVEVGNIRINDDVVFPFEIE